MKVLLLTDGIYPYVTGGMQKHSFYMVRYLLKTGARVTLAHCSSKPVEKDEAGNLFDDKSGSLNSVWLPFPSGPRFPGHYLYRSYQYSRNIFSTLEKELSSFDVIYIQGFCGWYLLKQLKKLDLKAKIITNFHGLEMFQLSPGLKSRLQAVLLRKYTRKNLQLSPYVHSLGGKLTHILREKIGIAPERIIVAPIGIERKWLRGSPGHEYTGTVNIAFVGRNERRKGFPELMEAIGHLKGKNIHLHVAGPFTGDKNENITWHGPIKAEEDMMAILDRCDVLICPSYAEGMPTVILEAMSRGCAIAATNVGAVSEQVDERNGWLFEPADKASLKKTLEKILDTDKQTMQEKKQRSLDKIKDQFLWDGLISGMFNNSDTAQQ